MYKYRGQHGVNDQTDLIFEDENGQEIEISINLEDSRELMEHLYAWTVVKHSDNAYCQRVWNEFHNLFPRWVNIRKSAESFSEEY